MKIRATGTYTNDFRTGQPSYAGLSALYVEASTPSQSLYGRIGRQTLSTGGVLGRFDGAVMSVKLLPFLKLQLVGGAPVDTPRSMKLDGHRFFYGVALPVTHVLKYWDLDVYAIRQKAYGFIDRQAVGAEARFVSGRNMVFGGVDYDTQFNAFNFLLLNGSMGYASTGNLSFSLDVRRAPLLFTTDAVIGQQVQDLGSLRSFYTDKEILQLSKDRTAVMKMFTISDNHPITKDISVNVDFTLSKMESMPASGGLYYTPGTNLEYYVTAQLVKMGLFKPDDSALVGVRYANATTSDRYFLDASFRFPVNPSLRINPAISFGYRLNKTNSGDEVSVQPTLRGVYSYKRWFQLEPEIGGDWYKDKTTFGSTTQTGYHVYLGIRRDF